jgi:hypothetical protein
VAEFRRAISSFWGDLSRGKREGRERRAGEFIGEASGSGRRGKRGGIDGVGYQ